LHNTSHDSCEVLCFMPIDIDAEYYTIKNQIMSIHRLLRLAVIVLAILLIPFVGMQLHADVAWSMADFVLATLILYGAGVIYEIIRTILTTSRQRMLVGIGLAVIVFVGWVELAVGVFGTSFAGS